MFSKGHTAPEMKSDGAESDTVRGAVHPGPVSVAKSIPSAVTAAVYVSATSHSASWFAMAPYSPNEKSKPCM